MEATTGREENTMQLRMSIKWSGAVYRLRFSRRRECAPPSVAWTASTLIAVDASGVRLSAGYVAAYIADRNADQGADCTLVFCGWNDRRQSAAMAGGGQRWITM